MRLLIPISAHTDAGTLLDYITRRFAGISLEVDLLLSEPRSLLQRWLRRETDTPATSKDSADTLQRALTGLSHVRSVRKHSDNSGDADAVLAYSRQLQSELILLEAPGKPGLLTAFGLHSATRRILCRAPCAVELARPLSGDDQRTFNVLLAVEANRLRAFPFAALQQLKWPAQTRLRIYAVVPPSVDWRRSEASASSLLLARQRDELEAVRMEVALSEVCSELTKQLSTVGEASFQVVHGGDQHITTHLASATGTALIVLDNATNELSFGANPALMSPATIALTAPCAVMFLPSAASSTAEASAEGLFSLETS